MLFSLQNAYGIIILSMASCMILKPFISKWLIKLLAGIVF